MEQAFAAIEVLDWKRFSFVMAQNGTVRVSGVFVALFRWTIEKKRRCIYRDSILERKVPAWRLMCVFNGTAWEDSSPALRKTTGAGSVLGVHMFASNGIEGNILFRIASSSARATRLPMKIETNEDEDSTFSILDPSTRGFNA